MMQTPQPIPADHQAKVRVLGTDAVRRVLIQQGLYVSLLLSLPQSTGCGIRSVSVERLQLDSTAG